MSAKKVARKIIRDLIVPPTRVCHALARVIFSSRRAFPAAAAAAFVCSPAWSHSAADLNQIDRGRLPAPEVASRTVEPGDPSAMISFDFEGPVLYHPGQVIKDHSVVFARDTFHVFYILNERWFGHATSLDLRRWEIHEPVLYRGGPDDWDSGYIWAPCVVPLEGCEDSWLMYYTGVRRGAQRTGLAYSRKGLWKWEKASAWEFEPFACDTAWCEWEIDTQSHFRDPHFFADGQEMYIINTARTNTGLGAAALARADGYFDWRDAGPLYVHNNWHLLESLYLLRHGGKYHLFFTEEAVYGTSHMSSDSLRSGWDVNQRTIIDYGHAAEITTVPPGEMLFSRHTGYLAVSGEPVYTIRFDSLFWDGDNPLVSLENPLGSDWTILWGTAFNRQPTFGDAFAFRGDDTTLVGFEGNWWIGTAEAFSGPFFGIRPGWRQGDGARGAIRSRTFTVTGRSMTLLVGGGEYPGSCWVALHAARDGSMLYSETGRGVETMDRRVWDLEPYHGREVYLEIVDDCTEPMGHINVDSIRESPYPANVEAAGGGLSATGAPALSAAAGGSLSSTPPEELEAIEAASRTGGRTPAAPRSVVCRPNPCNPSTTVSFSGCAGHTARVVIFSVAGRRIYEAETSVAADGSGSHAWDGTSGRGYRVAAGTYIAAVFDGPAMIGASKLVLVR